MSTVIPSSSFPNLTNPNEGKVAEPNRKNQPLDSEYTGILNMDVYEK
jgi:hypothetical protein